MAVNELWPVGIDLGLAYEQAERSASGDLLRPHVEYQEDPIGWIVDKLGVPENTLRWSLNDGYSEHSWDGTEDPLVVASRALAAWKNVGIESATGTGKSYLAACLCLWFLACHQNARVYSYAPKEDQLRLYMWTEIRELWPRFKRLFPTARLTDLRIRMDGSSDKWGAVGYAVQLRADEKSATGAQGAHAEHMLLIIEETPGVDPAVMMALENTCTSPHNLRLALGNPDSQHDELHRFCVKPSVTHVRISGHDHPNVVCGDPSIVPGAVSDKSLAERREDYGEDSRIYKSRGRGISPPEAADALIKRAWCDDAMGRKLEDGSPALGVDVANSENGDKAAIANGAGAKLIEVRSFACPDALQLGRDVQALMEADDVDPRHVGVDVVGVGAATVNGLKEVGLYVRALNGGSRPDVTVDQEADKRYRESEPFANLRSQMWWYMRRDLERGLIALPDDPELIDDLTEPVWWTRNGKIHVEPKEGIVKRLGRSPDKGDAAVYWNWVRPRVEPEPEPEPLPEQDYDTGYEEMVERYRKRKSKRRGF